MKVKRKSKKLTAKKMQKGTVGNFFVFGVLALLIVLGITAVGGLPSSQPDNDTTTVNVVTPTQGATHNTLQLQTFGYVTIAPTPTSAPPGPAPLCQPGGINQEPEIIAATSPASGQSVGATGEIKVWVEDEGVPMIAPGETINSDGKIQTPGNQYATAPGGGYLYEPAVYLDNNTAESGGQPHFPDYIKGQVNSNVTSPVMQKAQEDKWPSIGGMDPLPAGAVTGGCFGDFFGCGKAEYIWEVSSLGLSSGNHRAEFVIHDGDFNWGVGCVNIQIQ